MATNFTKDWVGWLWPGRQDMHDMISCGGKPKLGPMTSTSEPARQQTSPSPGVLTQDEATVVNPAPLDPAASRAEGAGAPGPARTPEVTSLLAWLLMVRTRSLG